MDDIVTRLRDYACLGGYECLCDSCVLHAKAADEIDQLRALCNDLYHDATCTESFCRLCGEGIREWEATRG